MSKLKKGLTDYMELIAAAIILAVVVVILAWNNGFGGEFEILTNQITELHTVEEFEERCGVIVFTNVIVPGDSSEMPICLLVYDEGEMFLWNGADPTVHMTITFKREIEIPFN